MNPPIPLAPCAACEKITCDVQCIHGILCKHCYQTNAPITLTVAQQYEYIKTKASKSI